MVDSEFTMRTVAKKMAGPLVVLAFLATCRAQPPTAPAPTARPSASSATVAPAPASAAPTVPAASASTAQPSAAPSPFHLVASGLTPILWKLGNTLLVGEEECGFSLMQWRDDRLVQDDALMKGAARCWNSETTLAGRWPDAAFLIRGWVPWAVRSPVGTMYRWKASQWTKAGQVDLHQLMIAPWWPDSVLALEVPRRNGPPWGYRLRLLSGPSTRAAPVPMAPTGKPSTPDSLACYTRLDWPVALGAFPTGEVVVVGASECSSAEDEESDAGPAPLVVERWRPNQRRSTFDTLPVGVRDSGSAGPVLFVGPADIWVAGMARKGEREGETVLAHFDGARWSLVGNALPGIPTSLVRDGRWYWMTTGTEGESSVWRGDPGRTWEKVAIPEGAGAVREVVARGEGDVWLVTENGVYRSLAPREPARWNKRECPETVMEQESRAVESGPRDKRSSSAVEEIW